MKEYTTIIFDADDTLVDYKADATRAFHAALSAVGRDSEEAFAACLSFDYGNWDKIGLGDVHLPHVQEGFHKLYREHVRAIFLHADKEVGLGDAAKAEEAFLAAFASAGTPVEGAEETVAALKKKYRVYAATNGLSSLQHSRLERFALDRIFVSEDLGAIKPTAAFFQALLRSLGERAEDCLMVGDSLSSDIAGARAAGMDCVFFDRRGTGGCPEGTRRICDLRELLDMLP